MKPRARCARSDRTDRQSSHNVQWYVLVSLFPNSDRSRHPIHRSRGVARLRAFALRAERPSLKRLSYFDKGMQDPFIQEMIHVIGRRPARARRGEPSRRERALFFFLVALVGVPPPGARNLRLCVCQFVETALPKC